MSKQSDIEAALTNAFNEIDKDKSGFIEQKELEGLLKTYFSNPACPDQSKNTDQDISKSCEEFLKAADIDGDKKISLSEFIKFFNN